MAEPSGAERRCANCGAALYEGAEWCNLCFTPASPTRSEVSPDVTAVPIPGAERPTEPESEGSGLAGWPCPVCGERNPIQLDACATCGTLFADAMRRDEVRVAADPSSVFRWSLIYPGLGHAKAGRGLDGLARGVLFTMLLMVAIMVAFSGGSAVLVTSLLVLFGGGAALVYVASVVEASRLAEGGGLLVSSRALLWTTVSILLGSVLLVGIVIGTSARR
jgi:hypothetical protein